MAVGLLVGIGTGITVGCRLNVGLKVLVGTGEAEGSIVVVMKEGTKVLEFSELVTLKSVNKTFVPVLPKQTHHISKESIPLSRPN